MLMEVGFIGVRLVKTYHLFSYIARRVKTACHNHQAKSHQFLSSESQSIRPIYQ